jgi:hypothetical protein
VEAGVITADEARLLAQHRELVAHVIRVDDFDAELDASSAAPWTPAAHGEPAAAEADGAAAATQRAIA